ncbi:MAG: 6-bladed beta-propeller [bacterium]
MSYSNNQKSGSTSIVETIDGVEYVHNTDTPLHPNKNVNFIEELSIGEEDQAGNVVLFNPFLHLVDENENIYISEFEDQVIKVFNANGKLMKTIGAKGQGPGEFNSIGYIGVSKEGTLIVHDNYSTRTSWFDSSGQFLRSIKLPRSVYSFILLKSASFIICETYRGQDLNERSLDVKEFDFEGKVIRYYDMNPTHPESLIVRGGSGFNYSGLPVSRGSLFKGDQKREIIYHCVNDKYSIKVFNSSGRPFRIIDRSYEPVPFTNKDAEKYRARYKNHLFKEVEKTVRSMKMPKVKSVIERMYVDDESRLWVKTNETKKNGEQTLTAYDIFNPDGYYYAKIWTDRRPYIFVKGKMYTMIEDPVTGFRTIKRFKVIWN